MSVENTSLNSADVPLDGAAVHMQTLWSSTLRWFEAYWLQIMIAALIAVTIVSALYAIRGFASRLSDPSRGKEDWLKVFGGVVGKTTSYFIIMVGIRAVAGYAQTPPAVNKVIGFFFTLAAVTQVAIWVRELILGTITYRTSTERFSGEAIINAMSLIRLLVSVVVYAVAAIVLLDNLGVNVTGLVAGLGVGGIAIGLAAQGIFADLFAALSIIFDRPFSKGDQIDFGSGTGTIEEIGMKSTRIRAQTGELRIIANKNLLDKEILNLSVRDHIRMSFVIGVAYETPPAVLSRIPAILKELVEEQGATASRAGFDSFGASSLDYALFVDVAGRDGALAHAIRDRLLVAIMTRFAQEGISIPYPTQTTFTAAPDGTLIMPYPVYSEQT